MPTLKQAFTEGHTRLRTHWEGHEAVLQEVGPVGYDLLVDDQWITHWDERRRTRRELARGIQLPSGETLAIPDDHDWLVER